MSNLLRHAQQWLHRRQLCLVPIVLLISACGGAHTLTPVAAISPATGQIAWLSPLQQRDALAISRWRAAVGSPLITRPEGEESSAAVDGLTIVSWNIALDSGDVVKLVGELRAESPGRPLVLLLQEAFRSGDDVPASRADAIFAAHLGRSDPAREIDDVARALGMFLYYVPSMRNGTWRHNEDRGNAVLSSVPLSDLAAIELPFEHQRRVAVAATIAARTMRGDAWSLRLASVHLDNLVGARNGWIATEYGRARQARGLREALTGTIPIVVAGDFNTWFGFSDQTYLETARAFPQTRVQDARRTFRGLLRLDHVFYQLPAGWTAKVRRGESSHGSDHYPLITSLTF